MDFKYERLSNFYLRCEIIKHGPTGCPANPLSHGKFDGQNSYYGICLRVLFMKPSNKNYKHNNSGKAGSISKQPVGKDLRKNQERKKKSMEILKSRQWKRHPTRLIPTLDRVHNLKILLNCQTPMTTLCLLRKLE